MDPKLSFPRVGRLPQERNAQNPNLAGAPEPDVWLQSTVTTTDRDWKSMEITGTFKTIVSNMFEQLERF